MALQLSHFQLITKTEGYKEIAQELWNRDRSLMKYIFISIAKAFMEKNEPINLPGLLI